jgi:ElaB/YqjD/DUF883 family membrane-anchored ribosome-binding protein
MSTSRGGPQEPIRDSLRQAADSAVGAMNSATESMSAGLKTVGLETEGMVDAAKDQAGQFQEMVAAEVRHRPFQALAVAALVGMWLGSRLTN